MRVRRHPAGPSISPHTTATVANARGAVVVTFGDNRLRGGRNASSLSAEFMSSNAEIEADGQPTVNLG
ncbi:MAG: hypothetical protein D6709_00985 [Chloroflexi bacterium]|uniref:Uncharacterized protein n=1 Tax=Candidatus Thermofonsia Clade 3 bacterium TaxID=2364212 RepID=A0A2M8QCZ9_9CHLR|nr:MAG: hypothetical protein CUN48_07355 [Candidatus Thermofonsia Clade 3 bacterium]RMG65999.1 MAG: hypothetical protein D6709_00985 [Chloroflexota bacterium]